MHTARKTEFSFFGVESVVACYQSHCVRKQICVVAKNIDTAVHKIHIERVRVSLIIIINKQNRQKTNANSSEALINKSRPLLSKYLV